VSGKTFPTYNPSTEAAIAQVQEGDKEDIDKAVKAARAAFKIGSEWRSMDASARGQMIHKLGQLMRRDQEYLAVC
jgi:acyl-CoA reductase-like NAD-dependent aldehyde dehydrogenase